MNSSRSSSALLCVAAICCILAENANPARCAPLRSPAAEDDGVVIPHEAREAAQGFSGALAHGAKPAERASGSWFLSVGAGAGFPQYDDGQIVNDPTGAAQPLKANANFGFTSLLSAGYRWFDPQRWGHWSFDADFVGAYLGVGISSLGGRSQINLDFLGLRGRVGYRVLDDRFEPFLGFAAGGVVANTETGGVSHGAVWGYWFAPVGGIRYYIPQSGWSISVEGLFRFLGGLNGFSAPGIQIDETPHTGMDGGWIYVPLGVVAIGYRF